jgi:uncharacterized peroxidase-related enzyme
MADQVMFLGEPPVSESTDAAFAGDRDVYGFVSNATRLWCWRPDVHASFAALRRSLTEASTLTRRDRAVLILATVSERKDPYCSLAWGLRLARLTDKQTAADVIGGVSAPSLSDRETALVEWARQLVRDPNGTTDADIAGLRNVGLTDREIFEATALVAFRLAFSTVNDALGALPDKPLADRAPAPVRAAVTYGRSPSSTSPLL